MSAQETMPNPADVLAQLATLPEPLRGDRRRFYVEAVTDETRAPLAEFYRLTQEAEDAAQAWAKSHGADGFYPPRQNRNEPSAVSTFSFHAATAPGAPAWTRAGRGFVTRIGYVAAYPSKRPAGKALSAELAALPSFPPQSMALDHLGAITDLRTRNGLMAVGRSDGKWHWSVPVQIGDRYFVSAVNHNYDLAEQAQSAARHLAEDHPEWAPSLDFQDDPISWRPGPGWLLLGKAEFDFAIAEENLRRAKARAA